MLRIDGTPVVARMLGAGLLAAALTGCARDCGPLEVFHTGGLAYGEAADHARARLVDHCMFALSAQAGAGRNPAPQCRCFARDMMKTMSPVEINVVSGGTAFLPARSGRVLAACAARVAAAGVPPLPRPRSRPLTVAPGGEPSAAPAAQEPAANEPAVSGQGPPGDGEKPKQD